MKTMTTWMVAVWTLFAMSSAQAASPAMETFESTIVEYVAPESARDLTRFFLAEGGRVLRLDAGQATEIETLKQAFVSGDRLRIEVLHFPNVDFVRSLTVIGGIELGGTERDFWAFGQKGVEKDDEPFVPTDVGTYEEANRLFSKLELGFRSRSQCYQRAMLWSHALATQNSVNNMKVFVFFTKKYIREYNYDWWFHVAPYVIAGGVEYVMDRTFTPKPMQMREWTDRFIHSREECLAVERYSDYFDNQEARHCYLRKVPMYYYQPLNVKAMDEGVFDTTFSAWELDHAARARRGRWPF